MADEQDSIVDRARRVQHSLEGAEEPPHAQVAVGGPCPACGERVEIVMHADSSAFTCGSCGGTFAIAG